MAEEHWTDYHRGIVAALKVMYDDNYDSMETVDDKKFDRMSTYKDAVVLKKDPFCILEDDVGRFFKEYNVIGTKGYGHGININDFYKVQGYALMYMVVDKGIGEIPIDHVTVAVLQYRTPRDTFKFLEQNGCKVIDRADGIWEIKGPLTLFPFQVVDLNKVGKGWEVFKIIVPGAREEDIKVVQDAYEKAPDGPEKDHLSEVLMSSIESNRETFYKMKEEGIMSDAVAYVFKDEFENTKEEGKKEAKEEVAARLLGMRQTFDFIAEACGWTMDHVASFAKAKGYVEVPQKIN